MSLEKDVRLTRLREDPAKINKRKIQKRLLRQTAPGAADVRMWQLTCIEKALRKCDLQNYRKLAAHRRRTVVVQTVRQYQIEVIKKKLL